MHEFTCPGLLASWVNAWLAAVGVTVLDPRIRLRWTSDGTPVAVLSSEDVDPIEALVERWPDAASVRNLPIAKQWKGEGSLERKVSVEQFVERVKKARGHPFDWTISSTMTDLSVDDSGEVAHAPFDPAGPGTVKWLHHRLLKAHDHVGPMTTDRLRDSLVGRASRVKNNGLGFDCTRLGSLADGSAPWVEPVVEVLAFFGLAMLPFRGPGTDGRLGRAVVSDERQRGWRKEPGGDEIRRFVWPAWQQPLTTAGIDALFDVWNPWRKQSWARLGIHSAWKSVRYLRRASADTTRAFGAEML